MEERIFEEDWKDGRVEGKVVWEGGRDGRVDERFFQRMEGGGWRVGSMEGGMEEGV
jgi:hypothetical protein